MSWLGGIHNHPEGKRRGYCSGCEQERVDRRNQRERKQQKRRKRVSRG